ncbi:hypothetical protein ABZ362_10630 [Streptomyces sp. NPDC005951]|uniref:hypothetical protein n=1 Tax=Streptomyces sp. NPDC005951 TaxID=3154573 RepID=UPI0033EDB0C1
MDLTVYGRLELWEDSPSGRPQTMDVPPEHPVRTNGRSIPQWSRTEEGRSADLTPGPWGTLC